MYFDDGHRPHVDVADALGDNRVVFIKNHGAIVASDSVENATIEAVMLEQSARYHLECAAMGGTEILEDEVLGGRKRCTRSSSCPTCGRRTSRACAAPTPTSSPGSTDALPEMHRVGVRIGAGVRPAARSRGSGSNGHICVGSCRRAALHPPRAGRGRLSRGARALGVEGFRRRRARRLLRPVVRARSRRALDARRVSRSPARTWGWPRPTSSRPRSTTTPRSVATRS